MRFILRIYMNIDWNDKNGFIKRQNETKMYCIVSLGSALFNTIKSIAIEHTYEQLNHIAHHLPNILE